MSKFIALALLILPLILHAATPAQKYEQARRVAMRDPKVRAAYDAADRKLAAKIVQVDPTLAGYIPGRPAPVVKATPAPKPVAKPTPKPKPVVKPTPKPKLAVKPTPAPKLVVKVPPKPKPVAKATPKPKPVVKPTPKPVVKPTPAPKPVAKPTPKPKPTPKIPSVKHKVVPGETFDGIAQLYRVGVPTLRQANPGVQGRNLQPGQVLIIPKKNTAPPYSQGIPYQKPTPKPKPQG